MPHEGSRAVLTATQGLCDELQSRGIRQIQLWSRGIDHDLFNPAQPKYPGLQNLAKPILRSVGRVAVEKNLEAFLDAGVPGTKVVVGDGPARASLGCLKLNLAQAISEAATFNRADAADYGAQFCWESCTDQFVDGISQADPHKALAA